MGSGTLVKK